MPELTLVGREALLVSVGSLLDRRRPVVLTGHAGVGKSHLARELSRRARAEGRRIIEARGDVASSAMPLGAFAFLIRPGAKPEGDMASALWSLQSALLGDDGRNALIYVDDAHLLDPVSVMLVARVARTSDARMLLTLRQGEDVPGGITELWGDGTMERVVVPALEREPLEQMVADLLGAQLSEQTAEEFWRLSDGNPLCARELVIEARSRDSITIADGVATHEGILSVNGRANEMIEARLAVLPGATARALRVLAAAGSVSTFLLERIVGAETLHDLERRQLVSVISDRQRTLAAPAHPLYGELMLQAMSQHQRRETYLELYEAARDVPARRRWETRERARWALEAGVVPEGPLFLEAAQQSLLTLGLDAAIQFAETTIGTPFELPGRRVIAAALASSGDPHGALAQLEMTEGLDATDDERAQVIAIAAAIEAFHLGDLGRGLARLSEAQESLTDPAAIDRVGVQRGQILLFAEGVDPVLGAVLPALEREPANSDDVLIHAAGVALAMTAWAGRLSEAAAFGQRALEVSSRIETASVFEALPGIGMQIWALIQSAQLEKTQFVLDQLEANFGQAKTINLTYTGMLHHWTGASATAIAEMRRGLPVLLEADPTSLLGWSAPLGLHAALRAADAEARRIFSDVVDALGPGARSLFRSEIDRALGAKAFVDGDPERGRELLRSAIDAATDLGKHTLAVEAIDDLAAAGYPDEALPLIERLLADADPMWVLLRLRHAWIAGRVNADADAVRGAAKGFRAGGFLLKAAECEADAAAISREAGDPASAFASERRSVRLQELCENSITPALARRPSVLGARGTEIADLVAQGLTSKEIADRLVLSTRTVENHVYRMTTLLEVDGRKGLADVVNGAREGLRDVRHALAVNDVR